MLVLLSEEGFLDLRQNAVDMNSTLSTLDRGTLHHSDTRMLACAIKRAFREASLGKHACRMDNAALIR